LKCDEQIDQSTSESFRSAVNDEGSLQFQDLQRVEVCSKHEEEEGEKQELSNLQLEHQKDLSSPYEYVIPNYDEERGEIFSNLFYHPIVDPAAQKFSSLLLRSHLDALIFDQYNDEQEDVKVCEDLLSTKISLSSSFQQRYMHPVIDACHRFLVQKPDENLYFLDKTCKEITVEQETVCCDKPKYPQDKFFSAVYDEEQQKGSDQ